MFLSSSSAHHTHRMSEDRKIFDKTTGLDGKSKLDRQLLQKIQQRDSVALEELYDKYSTVLFSIIRQVVREREQAEDILQEVFLQIWNRAETYHEHLGQPVFWMMRIARNRAIDHIRSKRFQQQQTETDIDAVMNIHAQDRTSNPERFAIAGQVSSVVGVALNRLPEEQRRLIELAYFEGYTQSELSKMLSIPLGTVKTRMRLGMIAMYECLNAFDELPQSLYQS